MRRIRGSCIRRTAAGWLRSQSSAACITTTNAWPHNWDTARNDVFRDSSPRNDSKFNTARAWWIETRDEKADASSPGGIGGKRSRVVGQTALKRYRSVAVRADTETDKRMADGYANNH